jgi:hypothetical protein
VWIPLGAGCLIIALLFAVGVIDTYGALAAIAMSIGRTGAAWAITTGKYLGD